MIFSACSTSNNTDTSDDGVIGDGTTMDMIPDGTEQNSGDNKTEEPTTDGITTEEQTSDEETSDLGDDSTQSQKEKKTITSDTGTGLNLVIEYTVGDKIDGARKIDIEVYIESYSLNVTARGNTNFVRVGDETLYFSTDAISYNGTEKKLTRVVSHTFTTMTDNETLPIYAMWNFNGVYSDKPISAIIIENNIEL